MPDVPARPSSPPDAPSGAARWADVERLFHAAAERDPAEREAFLDASGAAPGVLVEVRGLLAAESDAAAFFDRPHGLATLLGRIAEGAEPDDPGGAGDGANTPAPADPLGPGARVGPWRLGEELGRGGMGVVYRAERADGLYAQAAALKVLKRGMDSDAVVRRFLLERRVLAGLDHAGIARLLDGGTAPDGRPYLALELVDGAPITDYADARRLGVEDRLRLVVSACEAVAYAHRHLVVHRDLKPSNVLVRDDPDGGGPCVKLLDFGIAKVLGEADEALTAGGPRPFTPAYAAPEQLAGAPVTTATDVYALGALLFELLTGRRASPNAAAGTAPRAAWGRTADAERPSTVVLHPVAARGGAPDAPAPTAAARAAARGSTPERLRRRLAGDLDAVVAKALRAEPAARYPSADALAADLRRHLGGHPVAARRGSARYVAGRFVRRHRLGVAALAGAFVLLGAFALLLAREQRATAHERDKAQAVAEFLEDLFLEVDPASGAGREVTVREALDAGAGRVDSLRGQPEVQAHMLDVIGRVYRALGHDAQAEPLLREAVRLRARTFGPSHPATLEARHHLAYLLAQRGRDDEAERLYRAVLDARRRSGDPDGLVESTSDLADFFLSKERYAEAEAAVREGLGVLERHPNAGPDDMEGDVSRASLLYVLARIRTHEGRAAEAHGLFRTAHGLFVRRYGTDHLYVASAQTQLGASLVPLGRYAEAESLFVHARGTFVRAFGAAHAWTNSPLFQRADLLVRMGRTPEADRLLRSALREALAAAGPSDPAVQAIERRIARLAEAPR